jgi:DNA-binding NtrC family response regulator
VAAILVVDPDVDQVRVIQTALEAAGHAACLASSSRSAIQQLRDGGIELLIVHYVPGVDLDTLTDHLARLPSPPPFVLVSGALDGPAKSAHHGAAEFVMRPVRPEELMRVVQRLLESRSGSNPFDDGPTRPNEKLGSF